MSFATMFFLDLVAIPGNRTGAQVEVDQTSAARTRSSAGQPLTLNCVLLTQD